jgi:hypothetical protein
VPLLIVLFGAAHVLYWAVDVAGSLGEASDVGRGALGRSSAGGSDESRWKSACSFALIVHSPCAIRLPGLRTRYVGRA